MHPILCISPKTSTGCIFQYKKSLTILPHTKYCVSQNSPLHCVGAFTFMETRPDSPEKKLGQSSLVFSICVGAFTTALFTFNLSANAQSSLLELIQTPMGERINSANAKKTTTTPTSSQQTPTTTNNLLPTTDEITNPLPPATPPNPGQSTTSSRTTNYLKPKPANSN